VTVRLALTATAAAPSHVFSLSLPPAAPHGNIDVPCNAEEILSVTVTLRNGNGSCVPQASVHVTLTVAAPRRPC
jgi:hypothetical protein